MPLTPLAAVGDCGTYISAWQLVALVPMWLQQCHDVFVWHLHQFLQCCKIPNQLIGRRSTHGKEHMPLPTSSVLQSHHLWLTVSCTFLMALVRGQTTPTSRGSPSLVYLVTSVKCITANSTGLMGWPHTASCVVLSHQLKRPKSVFAMDPFPVGSKVSTK